MRSDKCKRARSRKFILIKELMSFEGSRHKNGFLYTLVKNLL